MLTKNSVPVLRLVPAGNIQACGTHFWVQPGRARKDTEPLENIRAVFTRGGVTRTMKDE